MINKRAKKYLLGIENKSTLKKNSIKERSIDLIITSPPYNLTGRLCLNIPLDKNKNGKNSVYADITAIAKKEVGRHLQHLLLFPRWKLLLFSTKENEKRWKKEYRTLAEKSLWNELMECELFRAKIQKDGTTLIEAINNQRYALGLEINQGYIKNSLERMKKECLVEKRKISENSNNKASVEVEIKKIIKRVNEKNRAIETYYKVFGEKWGESINSPSEFISFVPNANYDIALYNSEGYPIVLSIKTSLRERYKQADLEGMALKNVHRRAKSYLITLSAKEYEGVKRKIKEGDVAGLDEIILADTEKFDNLLDELANNSFVKPGFVEIIKGKILKSLERILDSLALEQEKGITIKLNAVQLRYPPESPEPYLFNLIDTPGHVDFMYEVSRSLAACEGVILLVDASQGIQAQTLAYYEIAKQLQLKILPVINKIDLPVARTKEVQIQLQELLHCQEKDIVLISAKTGQNVDLLLKKIITDIPSPA
ncbi:12039_t:CDS:2 [Racocetra persica]|uniref:12039_t:CDS:1 n=1 Tax=Racocetra persica TaxID=160502 RepID=A0ACA9MR49_9GLOM|nr:12039_t:CDS:2 [Racocetra persica]